MNDNCPVCCCVGWGCACGYGAPCECNDSDPPDTRHVTVVVEEALH